MINLKKNILKMYFFSIRTHLKFIFNLKSKLDIVFTLSFFNCLFSKRKVKG
jgi:hypothetical protein